MSTSEEMRALGDAFVQANANPEFIGAQLAQLVRRLLGASLAQDSYGPTTYATVELQNLLKYLAHMSSPAELRDAVAAAVSDLSVDGRRGDPWLAVAQDGARYLLARTTSDGFSAARASKAEINLVHSARRAAGSKS